MATASTCSRAASQLGMDRLVLLSWPGASGSNMNAIGLALWGKTLLAIEDQFLSRSAQRHLLWLEKWACSEGGLFPGSRPMS